MKHTISAFTIVALLFSAVVCIDCAALARHGDKDQFDPLGFPGDDTVVTQNADVRQSPVDTVASQPAPLLRPTSVPDTITVYRVQFFATTSLAEANDVLARARRGLKDSVSVFFETPYYKLKAGPFVNRDRAERLVLKLRAMGYESAWVVTERVLSPKPSQ